MRDIFKKVLSHSKIKLFFCSIEITDEIEEMNSEKKARESIVLFQVHCATGYLFSFNIAVELDSDS